MKASLCAAVLSCMVVTFPLQAQAVTPPVTTTVQQPAKKINLNTADVSILTGSFKGIGQKRAQAIVSFRDTHGKFKSVADLSQVKGLGQSFVNSHLEALQRTYVIE